MLNQQFYKINVQSPPVISLLTILIKIRIDFDTSCHMGHSSMLQRSSLTISAVMRKMEYILNLSKIDIFVNKYPILFYTCICYLHCNAMMPNQAENICLLWHQYPLRRWPNINPTSTEIIVFAGL